MQHDIASCLSKPTQDEKVVDEIDLRKCYVDVDKKFKDQHGIVLSLRQWQRLKEVIPIVDKKISTLKLNMQNEIPNQ